MTADVRTLADPVWLLLDGIANLDAFDGDFVDEQGQQKDPTLDEDGRIKGYLVYHPSPGWQHSWTLDVDPDGLSWTFQVTCAAGDRARALWVIHQVRKVLAGVVITIGGRQLLIEESGNPGPLRIDEDFSPPRRWAPLLFTVHAP